MKGTLRFMQRTLRFKLSLSVLAVQIVGLGGLCLLLYFAIRHVLYREFDDQLLREAQALGHVIEEHSKSRFTFEYSGIEAFEQEDHPSYFQFWKPDGSALARSRWLGAGDLPRRAGDYPLPVVFADALPDGRRGRYLQLGFAARWESKSQKVPPTIRQLTTVVVGRGTEDLDATLAQLRLWLLSLGSLMAALAAAAAAVVVGRSLRSTTALASEIGRIDEYHLGQRLAVADLPHELEEPVAKLNDLLGRLEESFARERRFTSDVSHELRTPLAGLRSVLEVTMSRQRAPEEYHAAMVEALEIVAQVQSMVENLLTLARVDSREIELHVEPVALRSFVAECWRLQAPRARARRLFFVNEIPEAATLETDRDKLRMIVTNLLSNAAEYTAEGGHVSVRTAADGNVLLDVCDSGPPIPEPALARIFDRFYRADSARSNPGAHCGIGLALVRALCEVLGWQIGASNLADGSVRFRLSAAERKPVASRPTQRTPPARAA